jgi:hypothetical protein
MRRRTCRKNINEEIARLEKLDRQVWRFALQMRWHVFDMLRGLRAYPNLQVKAPKVVMPLPAHGAGLLAIAAEEERADADEVGQEAGVVFGSGQGHQHKLLHVLPMVAKLVHREQPLAVEKHAKALEYLWPLIPLRHQRCIGISLEQGAKNENHLASAALEVTYTVWKHKELLPASLKDLPEYPVFCQIAGATGAAPGTI